jgi:hypothetical protein
MLDTRQVRKEMLLVNSFSNASLALLQQNALSSCTNRETTHKLYGRSGLFYNSRDDMIYGTNLITAFNKIVGIRANPNKSAYVAINCTRNKPIEVDGVPISHANPKTRHRLLGAYFSSAHGTRESLRHAKNIIEKLTTELKLKKIGPTRLRYIINTVIVPSAGYQLSFCPIMPPSLRGLATIIATAIENSLRLPKDFPSSIIFSRHAFGATEPKAAFLQKSFCNLMVSLQPSSRSQLCAKAFVSHLSWELCDLNNSLTNPVQLGTFGDCHPLAAVSSLMSQYKLSIGHPSLAKVSRLSKLLQQS